MLTPDIAAVHYPEDRLMSSELPRPAGRAQAIYRGPGHKAGPDRAQASSVGLRRRDGSAGNVPTLAGGWSVEELAAQARDDDVESFVEFGGAVVGGQDGGEGAQPGELGDG